MNIVTSISEWRNIRAHLSNVGFVPTMGHLHEGHLALAERAKQENDVTVVSIFVNPTQFNQSSDFDNYPKTIERDCELLAAAGVDYAFIPAAKEIYHDNYSIKLLETDVSSSLEGEHRPGHFEGVMTVILKLLNILQPARIYFGKKDYQQYLLIQKMVEALFLPVKVVGCETVRATNGLALSSRNSRLSEDEKTKASIIFSLLTSKRPVEEIKNELTQLGFRVEYVADQWGRRLAAVWLGEVRLIDNVEV